jgi:uncharacterized membrane protein YkgB
MLKRDLDYHFFRASMVIVFLFFGYQKWFDYEAQALVPYISHGPPLSWMYLVFGVRGATYFLGVAELVFATLLFAGFWNKKLGFLLLSVPVFHLSQLLRSFLSYPMVGCVCRRFSGDDRKGCVSHEGLSPLGSVSIFGSAGYLGSATSCQS